MVRSQKESIAVCLADDHQLVREGLRVLLEAEGDIHVVGEASDGRTAIALVADRQPDIVVMDITMPELNGIDATRRIREEYPSTRVVILSMHATREHVFRAIRAGADGYVLKESAANEVVSAVRSVARGHRYLSEKIVDLVIDDYIQAGEQERSPLDRLSAREREIFQLTAEGKSLKDIAETLFLSPKSVETYRSRVYDKLGVRDLPGLVKLAIQFGIIDAS
ncbi:MAG: response regulator transcription factor [Bacteroidota bacterium]|nr:response regulator transcription factor [Bacteroidota bacterium]